MTTLSLARSWPRRFYQRLLLTLIEDTVPTPHLTRRQLLAGASTATVAAVTGCLGRRGGGESTGGGGAPAEQARATDDAPATVGMVYALGGLDDRSFNDAANRGAQRARLDHGIAYTNHEPDSIAELGETQATLAASSNPAYDLVCCVGFRQADGLESAAAAAPDQQFMIVDTAVDASNVASYVFEEQIGSFQAGRLAALLTTRDIDAGGGATNPDARTVGFVGGVDEPLTHGFHAGFQAGVTHTASDIDVLAAYIGDFEDVEAARTAAAAMYDAGADIVYHAAGGAGVGVLQAAQANGRYAIGVDSDQSRSNPRYADVVLASMVKRIDTAVYDAIEATIDGDLPAGDVVSLGLATNGVSVQYGTQLGPAIPDAVTDALGETREALVAGDITVPTERPQSAGGGGV